MTDAPIQLLYASHDGQTERIAYRMAAEWKFSGVVCEIYNLAKDDPDPFLWPEDSIVVILAPIRYGFHLPKIDAFIRKNRDFLDPQRLVMVSVNLTARKAGKNAPRTNPYFRKWVRRHGLRPALGAVFGGKLDYPRYPLWEKWAIRLIMLITGGPTDFRAVVDYTAWNQVDALARRIRSMAVARREAA